MSIDVKKDWWKTLFDDIYLITDSRSVGDESITRREVDLICELLSLNSQHRILDLCGGQGRHTFEFCSRGFENCTLFDYSHTLVEKARGRAKKNDIRIRVIQGDARDTGLPEESFDVVCILGNSLGYISDAEADSLIVNEARRVLVPGGRLLIDVADGDFVRDTFSPTSWHETGDDIVVCRQREMKEDSLNTREMVMSKGKGLVRDESYSIRLYDENSLRDLVSRSEFADISILKNFSAHHLKGDYGFMNNRMISVAVKA